MAAVLRPLLSISNVASFTRVKLSYKDEIFETVCTKEATRLASAGNGRDYPALLTVGSLQKQARLQI